MVRPLVTVGVYTYNSSNTVIETLESVKSQTYESLELVISDDHSTDNTIELCREWTKKNVRRFVNIQILESECNTGQSGNYNRALLACTGEWIKDIDGDDLLTPNCIQDYIAFVNETPDAVFVFGKADVFGPSTQLVEKFLRTFDYDFFKLPVREKYERLVNEGNCIPSPSAFSNVTKRKAFNLLYDERIPNLEDLPMWVNATKRGYDLFFLDKIVCRYRVGGAGITSGSHQISESYKKNLRKYEIYYKIDPDNKLMPQCDNVISRIVDQEFEMMNAIEDRLVRYYEDDKAYKIGCLMMWPYRWVRRQLQKWS